MPLAVLKSNQGKMQHEKIAAKLVEVNSLPNIQHKLEKYIDDCVCIVSLSNSLRDKVHITDSHVVAVEGDIINVDSPASLITLFEKYGSDIACHLNGNFNIIIYERSPNNLFVCNCRSALHNFYYAKLKNGWLLASNINSIIRCQDLAPSCDFLSLLKLFSFNYIYGNKTMIQGIERMPPAHIISIGPENRHRSKSYWQPVFGDYFDYNLLETAREFNRRLIKATKERFDYYKDIKIFLSGGLDSRLIAAAAEKSGCRTETITYGFEGANDVVFGSMCSEKLGYTNHRYITEPGKSTRYSDILSLVVWLTAAETNIKSLTSLKYHDFLLKNNVHNYSHGCTIGLLSSKLIQPYMLFPIGYRGKIATTFEHLTRSSTAACDLIFEKDFVAEHRKKMFSDFSESFSEIKGENFCDKFISWYLMNREPRTTYTSMKVNGYYFNSVCFFLDKALMDFYFRVPLKYRQEALWEKMSCLTINEKIRDVPYHLTGKPISSSLPLNLYYRLRAKITRNRKSGYRIRHKDARKDTLGDTVLRSYLLDSLQNTSAFSGVIDVKGIKHLVQEHFAGNKDYTLPVLNIATLYKFHEIFMNEKCAVFPEEAHIALQKIPYPALDKVSP